MVNCIFFKVPDDLKIELSIINPEYFSGLSSVLEGAQNWGGEFIRMSRSKWKVGAWIIEIYLATTVNWEQ